MALNKEAVGRKGKPASFEITDEKIRKYAEATNEDNPLFSSAEGLLAPPCFAFTYSSPGMARVLGRPDLGVDFLRLVHGEQEFRYHQPAWSNQTVASEAVIAAIETKDTGETLTIDTRATNEVGELLTESRFVFFIRAKGGVSGKKTPEPEPARDWLFKTVMEVTPDQATRYGQASGDRNPIHMDPEAGKRAGLGGVILHGLCTMAFASQAVIDGCLDGDATRLKRFGNRFARPVRPGDTVTTRVWSEGEGRVGFDAVIQDGTVVLKNGIAEFV